jgi:hypothetical protein
MVLLIVWDRRGSEILCKDLNYVVEILQPLRLAQI